MVYWNFNHKDQDEKNDLQRSISHVIDLEAFRERFKYLMKRMANLMTFADTFDRNYISIAYEELQQNQTAVLERICGHRPEDCYSKARKIALQGFGHKKMSSEDLSENIENFDEIASHFKKQKNDCVYNMLMETRPGVVFEQFDFGNRDKPEDMRCVWQTGKEEEGEED
jgi:hypothetical protein